MWIHTTKLHDLSLHQNQRSDFCKPVEMKIDENADSTDWDARRRTWATRNQIVIQKLLIEKWTSARTMTSSSKSWHAHCQMRTNELQKFDIPQMCTQRRDWSNFADMWVRQNRSHLKLLLNNQWRKKTNVHNSNAPKSMNLNKWTSANAGKQKKRGNTKKCCSQFFKPCCQFAGHVLTWRLNCRAMRTTCSLPHWDFVKKKKNAITTNKIQHKIWSRRVRRTDNIGCKQWTLNGTHE